MLFENWIVESAQEYEVCMGVRSLELQHQRRIRY